MQYVYAAASLRGFRMLIQADARRRAVELGVIEAIIKSMTACANDALVSHLLHKLQRELLMPVAISMQRT